jgi:hypothetical protein
VVVADVGDFELNSSEPKTGPQNIHFAAVLEKAPRIRDKDSPAGSINADQVGRWPSGQWQQTVNLSPKGYGGSNPSLPTINHPLDLVEFPSLAATSSWLDFS